MGIDGIGRGGPPAAVGSIAGDGMQVGGPAEARASEGLVGSEALAKLQRGEINLPQYLDATVEQALSHLQGQLSPEQLSFVRVELRRELETDPALLELVQRSTGRSVESAGGQSPVGKDD